MEDESKVFLIYQDDHVISVLETIYNIYWITYIEPSLHIWKNANLIIKSSLFDAFLNLFVNILLRIFESVFTREIGL